MSLNAINTPMGGGPELVYEKTGSIGSSVQINDQNLSGMYSLLTGYTGALIYLERTASSSDFTPWDIFSGFVFTDSIGRANISVSIHLYGESSSNVSLTLQNTKILIGASGYSGGFWLKIYGIK